MDFVPQTPASAVLSGAVLLGITRFLQMIVKGRKYGARQYMVVSEETLWRHIVPSWTFIPGVIAGNNRPYHAKYNDFLKAGKDAYMQVAMTNLRPNVFIADPQAIKKIGMQRSLFIKDVESGKRSVGMFGHNLGTVEGDDWKRHRKANQRAFNEKNIQLVWSETVAIVMRLHEIWDKSGKSDVYVGDVPNVTEMLALLVISTAAFGQQLSWDPADENIPAGRKMSFQGSLRNVSANLIFHILTPSWATGLTKKTREVATAFSEFPTYLQEMIAARRKGSDFAESSARDTPHALSSPDSLFNILIAASDQTSDGKKTLDDDEVAGSAFLFLFAGHETTAHALAFSLGLLAVHPDIQEEVYAQVKQVIGTRDKLEYSDLPDLKLVSGTFMETLRMYPVVDQIHKTAAEDTIISVSRNGPGTDKNSREDFFIPKGARIWFSILAAHYNPIYWPEPEEFRPHRFLGSYNKDAFLTFSTGHRSCIGRKFAETEGIAALAMFLAKYQILVDTDKFPTIPGETRKAQETRLLNPSHFVTLSPTTLPLIFRRRHSVP